MVRNHNENRERIRNQAHHRFNPSTGGCLVRWRPVGLGVVAVVASCRSVRGRTSTRQTTWTAVGGQHCQREIN